MSFTQIPFSSNGDDRSNCINHAEISETQANGHNGGRYSKSQTRSSKSNKVNNIMSEAQSKAVREKLDSLESIMTKRYKRHKQSKTTKALNDYFSYSMWLLIAIVTIFTYPESWNAGSVNYKHVWYYGWITAICTGVGILPFYFISEPDKFWLGISNGAYDMSNTATHFD
jgi:hypothetical protein